MVTNTKLLGSRSQEHVSVRDEQVLAGLFATVLDVESVGIEEDFFQLGGDSLTGADLMTAIEKRFGVILSLSILLEAPTPRALAEALFKTTSPRSMPWLIGINPDGVAPTIFYVHGNTGESTVLPRLSAIMGNRAFYGFRGVGLEPGEEFLTSVGAMAATYNSAIAQVLPTGPLVLLGHCGGSVIVYEMAQLLSPAGRKPLGVILIDPETTLPHAPYLHKSGLALSLLHASLRKRAADLDRAIRSTPNPTGADRRILVSGGIKLANGLYVPKRYEGSVLLLYTAERKAELLNKERGFPALVTDLETVELSSDHGGMFAESLPEVQRAIELFLARL